MNRWPRTLCLWIGIGIALGCWSQGTARVAEAEEAEGSVKHSSGRPLPKMPAVTKPVLFHTPEADKILAALQVFPPDNPWNEDISKLPLHANSKNLIASVGAEKSLAYNLDMCFVIVPPDQKKIPVNLVGYADESDPGPYPVPDNAPIEDWPIAGGTLANVQRNGEGD